MWSRSRPVCCERLGLVPSLFLECGPRSMGEPLESTPEPTEGLDDMQWQVGLYAAAVLIPLFAFAVEAIFIRQLKRLNAYIATGAIGLSFLLSLVGFLDYFLIEAEGVWAEHHAAAPAEPGATAEHGGE